MKLWSKNDNLNKKIEEFTVGDDRYYDLFLAKYDDNSKITMAVINTKRLIISPLFLNTAIGWTTVENGLKSKIKNAIKGINALIKTIGRIFL